MFTRNSDQDNSKSSNNQESTSARAKPVEEPSNSSGSARETVISNDLTIHGNVTSEGIVRLEGTIIGDMNCTSLVVENDGSISGNISAEQVKVHGRVGGTVHGTNVMLHSSAFVEGDIYHQGISIEMGTHYDGRLKWVKSAEEGEKLSNKAQQPIGNDNQLHAQAAE
jgi:cytoskeletal protein CcmA (bactofilin family)